MLNYFITVDVQWKIIWHNRQSESTIHWIVESLAVEDRRTEKSSPSSRSQKNTDFVRTSAVEEPKITSYVHMVTEYFGLKLIIVIGKTPRFNKFEPVILKMKELV